MTLQEILESERADLVRLRRLRDKHPHDAETQRIVAELLDEKSERMAKLNELAQYRDTNPRSSIDAANDIDKSKWVTPWG